MVQLISGESGTSIIRVVLFFGTKQKERYQIEVPPLTSDKTACCNVEQPNRIQRSSLSPRTPTTHSYGHAGRRLDRQGGGHQKIPKGHANQSSTVVDKPQRFFRNQKQVDKPQSYHFFGETLVKPKSNFELTNLSSGSRVW